MSEPARFASPAWLATLERIYSEVPAERLAGLSYSMCEVFDNVPPDVNEDAVVAWHIRLVDGELSFDASELADAEFKISGDWATIEPIAKLQPLTDPGVAARADSLLRDAQSKGLVKITGSRERRPDAFVHIHDEIAALTS